MFPGEAVHGARKAAAKAEVDGGQRLLKNAYGRKKVLRFYDVRPDAKKDGAKAVCN